LSQFINIHVQIIGASPDDLISHDKFTKKHKINFPLLYDKDHELANKLGVWVEKNMYGKKYWGIQRSTFIIDSNGRVEKIWESVKPDGHASEVLEYLKQTK
jgi:peroxiredoxin Q/BCP